MVATEAPIRVMHMLAKYEYGGAQRVIRDIIACSEPGRFQYQVCGLLRTHAAREWIDDLGVQFVSADMGGVPSPSSLSRLVKLVRDFQPDILHCHSQAADVIAWTLRRSLGNPGMVATVHNMAEYYYEKRKEPGRRCEAWLHKIAMNRWPGTVVGIGAAIRQSFAPYIRNWDQMPLVENGIDEVRLRAQSQRSRQQVREDLGIDEDAFIFLSAGRLTEQKRYDVLVQAVSLLDEPDLQYVSLVAGTGPLENQVRDLVSEHDLEHRIRLLGVRDDVPDLMNAADCFLMTSEVEGLPMALLEAMMLGLPTVSTAVGAIPDVITDGATGRLTPSEDTSAIARAMREVLNAPQQARIWGEQAREQARSRYSALAMTRKYEQLYRDLTRTRAKGND